jgi:hypothetical protein
MSKPVIGIGTDILTTPGERDRAFVYTTYVDSLRKAGASHITVVGVRYVFENKSWSFEALRRRLAGEAAEELARWP